MKSTLILLNAKNYPRVNRLEKILLMATVIIFSSLLKKNHVKNSKDKIFPESSKRKYQQTNQ
jgi:hypothetical protein